MGWKEMIILIAGLKGDQRSFQTQFLRRQDLDWRQPLSKMGRSRGSHRQPLVCLSFPFFLIPPHLPSSPRLRPLSPHPSLPYFYPISPSTFPVSLPPPFFFLKKIQRAYTNK
jgi:hypothetical protein